MSSVFKPNNAALRKMERELQRSFNKFNITVPVRIEQPEIPHDWVADTSLAANSTIINAGDNSQITVNSQNVQQSQTIVSELDSFGDLRMVMQEILCKLSDLELTDEDSQELKESAEEVIAELDSDAPDTGKIRGFARLIKRILTPIATAAIAGAATGTGALVQQWIETLTQAC